MPEFTKAWGHLLCDLMCGLVIPGDHETTVPTHRPSWSSRGQCSFVPLLATGVGDANGRKDVILLGSGCKCSLGLGPEFKYKGSLIDPCIIPALC